MKITLQTLTTLQRRLLPAALVSLLLGGVVAAQEAKQETGSINGKISVSGVKNAENVLVYLEEVSGEWKPTKDAEVDQIKLQFTPHVLPVVKGTTVSFKNSDPILHNIFWPKGKGYSSKNLGTWGKGAVRKYTFNKQGAVVLLCNVHPEMEGHVVVLQNPFFTVVGKDGEYQIKNVPPGKYTVNTWYPRPKKLKGKSASVTVAAGQEADLDFSLSRR